MTSFAMINVRRATTWGYFLILCGQACTALLLPAGEPPVVPRHLQAAEELVAHVSPKNSSYEHKHGTVHWGHNGTGYECHTDCSGLLNHLLNHVYGITDADLRSWLDTARPTAKTYHQAIIDQQGFRRILRLSDVQPGDVIAVKYPRGSENTGHIMIVSQRPRPRQVTPPLIPGTEQWEVGIIDSTSSGHGHGDTRLRPDGSFNNGIGAGLLRVYTDRQGHVVGHTWSTARASTYRGQDDRNIEIGRLVPRERR